MSVELRPTAVQVGFTRIFRDLWHYVDDDELDPDDPDEGPLDLLVGATEDRTLSVEEALHIAEFYGGTWDEEVEQLGMAAALQTLADVIKLRGWAVGT